MENDRLKKYVDDVAMQFFWLSSQEYGKFLDEESDRWKALLTEVDLMKK
jgi:tripartite-type tricarboxylate transporter receptor subunit TctC